MARRILADDQWQVGEAARLGAGDRDAAMVDHHVAAVKLPDGEGPALPDPNEDRIRQAVRQMRRALFK